VQQELVAAIETPGKRQWFYRKSWLTKPNETDFPSLTDWLAYASRPEGSAASVSLYFSPAELETLGTGIFDAFQDTLNTFGPVLRAVYSTPGSSRHWIFQGNPDQFDVDGYIRSRQELLWSVRQHKDHILVGDRVLLWRSGATGGVIADCSVIAPPSKEILEDAPELWKVKPDIQAGEMRCRLRVEDSFVDTPIARAAIRTVLPDLSIVKAPQGTNFEITQEDYEKIMKLREAAIHEPLNSTCVDAFEQALRDADVVVTRTLVIRMISSLVSKNFVLLTGLAGSGKTKIAQAIARWLPSSSSCFRVVAVGADWTGNENVLGYPNGLEQASYVSKPSLDIILHAKANQAIPHFLILDEMNLSHVERYFADILSAIESDEKIHLHQDLERKANGTTIPAEVELPKNLFIIGTVNVDETTYMFSPKVLDRANVIEFRMDADHLAGFLVNPAKPDLAKLDGKGASFGKAFVDAAKNPVAVPADVKAEYDAEMLLFFKTLQAHGAEFGYRTAYETARFTHFYKLLGNHPDGDATWFPGAFDCVVFQKLLPKLHGSRAKLGPVLKKLWFLCVNDAAGRGADALKAAEEAARSTDKKAEPSVVVPAGAPYPLSAEKIGRMWRLLIENGFASFAEA
jgi:energy-coupling factor transporter ATP-binding protein EcfA2